MSSIPLRTLSLGCLLSAAVLAFATPLYSAENASTVSAAATAPASAPVARTAEQKTALDALDALDGVLARFEAMLNRDDDGKHKAAEQPVFDAFTKRRAPLGQTFDQGRYDELRVDLNLEYQRLASWLAAPTTPPVPAKAPSPATLTAPK